ncbi:hypothetical protein O181_034775 [Austropuccinia psidii MF-1]|uniref:Uncharacterized protein n=1 Tax=Austropuccinia psidii MF-1 TaxID=1389203 RepID=A0A9Q3D3L5_9BASI|nr:hypothetical protein [Austropuccinia psidii MF-1]
MPVQHSLTAKNTRSQRSQAVLTPTAKAPLDHTPSVHQLSSSLERGPPMEGEEPSRRSEEEDSKEAEEEAALACAAEASEAPNLALSHVPLVSQAETNFPR